MTDETQQAATPAEETVSVPESENLEAKPSEPVKAEEAKPETKEEPTPEGGDEKKKPSGSERLRRKNDRLQAELAATQRELDELRKKAPEKPTNDFFEDPNAHVASTVRDTMRQEREAELESRQQSLRSEAMRELTEDYSENVAKVRERIPDFDQVVAKVSNVTLPQELAEEILHAGEKAPLISYYLAQNPDKLIQLANLSGKALAREVGRIEMRVHLPNAKKATEATPPPTEVKGGAAPAFDPFKSDDMGAYIKWRQGGGGLKG